MKVAFLTREFAPEVYGGAGVYADHLAAELARIAGLDLTVHCFGGVRDGALTAKAYEPWNRLAGPAPHATALQTMSVDLAMAAGIEGADIVHSNTWYTNLAGHLAKLLYQIPHVATSHSLEPLRRWKADQLGAGYALSSFCEQIALESADGIIAVSVQMRSDILLAYPTIDPDRIHVIHNGVDAQTYHPVEGTQVLEKHGISPDRPIVAFVGRITQQKGLVHLLKAAELFHPSAQLVLCASAPDNPEMGRQFENLARDLHSSRGAVFWINQMLPRPELLQLLTNARVFVCPSVYEPFGLVNLEAMACETPVVASHTGGIPEIIVEGETGFLIPLNVIDGREPENPESFERTLAERVNHLIEDPALAARLGKAGRQRVIQQFSWTIAAEKTTALYRSVL